MNGNKLDVGKVYDADEFIKIKQANYNPYIIVEKLECSIQCVGLKLNSSEKIEKSLKTVKDFQNSAIADYQKLIDLIARYNKLKNLIYPNH